MDKDRIKYYSSNDIMCGRNLNNLNKLINKFNDFESIDEVQDINDIIELYNAKKYFDNEIYLPDWSEDNIIEYRNATKENFVFVAKYFNSINQEKIINLYKKVQKNYKEDFWFLIDKFNTYKKISKEKFKEFINTTDVSLYELLKHKKTTKYFGNEIKKYMLENYYLSAELLLNEYEVKHTVEREKLCIPEELDSNDKEKIISKYIDDENPNLNYLGLITNIQSNKDELQISPKTLLKAKKRAECLEKQFFNENSGIEMETKIVFSDTQHDAYDIETDGFSTTAKYSKKWIEDNSDYATLLNNFIYLFEFVDYQMRCTLVNKISQMGVLERTIITKSKKDYVKGIVFNQKNILSLLQMNSYYNELFSIGIRLEEIIEWFFEEYLDDEFNVCNFKINMPSAGSTMLEKCTNIMPAMESVLKQFILFVEEGNIDFELLEIRSDHLFYKDIPSLIERKYVYGIGKEYNNVCALFFSDQSPLAYIEEIKKSYNNFYELLCNEEVKIEDYPEYCKPRIDWLKEKKYILVDEDEYIRFNNKFLIIILRDIYNNEVISYWKYSDQGRNIIDNLEQKNIIEFESSLFSRPEQAYINYFLNKAQFNNGLDLRNKYSHTQPDIDERNIHMQNYMIFLRLFILVVIKLNDEFCTWDLISE